MNKITLLLPLLIAFAGCREESPDADTSIADTQTASAAARYETVARVVDGDTFLIEANWSPYDLEWKIRLLGIDTPEKGRLAHCQRERDLSAKASTLAAQLLQASGNRVRLQKVKHDKFGGRLDATVILSDNSSLQQRLIDAGLARPYNGDGPKPNWCRA